MATVSWFRRAMPLSRRVRIVASLLPKQRWFRFALLASKSQGRASNAMGGNGKLTELWMRDHWLRELTSHGTFPIPQRIHGREELDRYTAIGPVLYCSTHLSMFEICLRALVELGHRPVAVADDGRIVDGQRYPVIGMSEKLPALRATPYTLTQMRSLLLSGKSVACMADSEYMDTDLSDNLVRFAYRLRIPVIFTWAKLGTDNVFDVMFQPAQSLYGEGTSCVEESMNFLRRLHRDIRQSLGLAIAGVGIPTVEIEPRTIAEKDLRSEAA